MHTFLRRFRVRVLGWFKNPLSSQTEKLMAGTKFSDYLGPNHYKKAKKLKHFIHLNLATRPQSLSTYSNTPRYAPPRYAYPADTPLLIAAKKFQIR